MKKLIQFLRNFRKLPKELRLAILPVIIVLVASLIPVVWGAVSGASWTGEALLLPVCCFGAFFVYDDADVAFKKASDYIDRMSP